MQLRQLADGSFAGTFETKTMVAALSGCPFTKATIKFIRTAVHTPEAYAQAARLYQIDSRAVEAYFQGLRGKVKEALPVLQQGMADKEKIFGENHPQLLPYYFFLAQLHDAAGQLPRGDSAVSQGGCRMRAGLRAGERLRRSDAHLVGRGAAQDGRLHRG